VVIGVTTDFLSYIYTQSGLYFPATNGTNGVELWKSDGTLGGTSMVADIIPGLDSSKPKTLIFFLVNNKILFEATNGDDPNLRDLYAVDGIFVPLPVSLSYFTVKTKSR
jgi:ELWxxDGT repeat protein